MVVNTIQYRAELKKRMMEFGLKNKDLAKLTGYSINSIDCVTSGYRGRISDNLAAAIYQALNMSEAEKAR